MLGAHIKKEVPFFLSFVFSRILFLSSFGRFLVHLLERFQHLSFSGFSSSPSNDFAYDIYRYHLRSMNLEKFGLCDLLAIT